VLGRLAWHRFTLLSTIILAVLSVIAIAQEPPSATRL
jgi:hypothetical protein